jgi:hypothetical protein
MPKTANSNLQTLSKLKLMYWLRLRNIADPIYTPHYPQQQDKDNNAWQTPAVLPIPLSMEPVDPNSSPKQIQHTELHACCTIRPASPAEQSPAEQSKQTDRQTTPVEAEK